MHPRCFGIMLGTSACVVLSAACQDQEPTTAAFTETDSSGVSIIESVRPLWDEGERWTVSSEPEVVIGRADGDERYLLSTVAGVRRLPDGRIAILDGGSFRVRLYDGNGRHLVDLGGAGDGPSEFRSPQFLDHAADSLFVFEVLGGRVKWFSPSGDLIRTSSLSANPDAQIPSLHVVGLLEDRFLIGVSPSRSYVEGLNRAPWSLWRVDLRDFKADSILSVPGGEQRIFFPSPGVTGHQRYVFGKHSQFAVWEDHLYVAQTEAFSIRVFDRDGRLHQVIRRVMEPRGATETDFEQWIEEELDRRGTPPGERPEQRRLARELTFAETMPAFRSLATDSEGHLWIEEWEGVGFDQGRFAVLRPDGAWLGYVDVPDGLSDMRGYYHEQWIEIGPDYILGVWTDEYGVDQVRLYGLEKP